MKVKLVVISTILILSSCLGTKYLEEGESILHKQKIKSKVLDRDEIESLTVQRPNTHLFFLPFTHLVYLYEKGNKHFDSTQIERKKEAIREKYDRKIAEVEDQELKSKLHSKKIKKMEKKDTKLREGNLFMRWGEKLSVYDSFKLETTKSNIKSYLFTKGYFDVSVKTLELKTEDQKTDIELKVIPGPAYIMDSMMYVIEDPVVDSLFQARIENQLLAGEQYNEDLITDERNRVYNLLANNGYFDFKRNYVFFEVDSTSLEDNRLIIKEVIANPPKRSSHKKFVLDSVSFTTNPNDSYRRHRAPAAYNGITYDLTNNRFYERVIDWRIFIYPDDVYSKKATIETQKQLSYLDMFKFVNINHDSTDGKFVANIFTSPLDKYETSLEGGLSVINQAKIPGPFVNFTAKNRNTFKGLEILQFNGGGSVQAIKTTKETSVNSRYTRFQYGGEVSLTFPQFLFPMRDKTKALIGQYNPKTKMEIGVNFENRLEEYNRTTFNTGIGYLWQVSDNSRLSFKPMNIRFIDSKTFGAFGEELDSLEAEGNRSYVSAFKPSFVSSAELGLDLNFHNYGVGNHDAAFLSTSIEYGGLAQNAFNEITLINKLTSYKYLKGNVDFRQNIRIDSKTAFAYRAHLGMAYVYGKNDALPYEKYFFAGGSNSIRAWQPRRLGPGSYALYTEKENGVRVVDYDREEPGDILIELSAELRREFIGIIDYAIFVDAGNVWLWKSETIQTEEDPDGPQDNGHFRFDSFLSEMAVGAGAGLRLDFSFLVMRLDGAYKVFDPAMPQGDRFVLDELKYTNLLKRLNLNIGIGYPF